MNPIESFVQGIIFGRIQIVIPVRETIESLVNFECAIGSVQKRFLCFFVNDAFVAGRNGGRSASQRIAAQRIVQNYVKYKLGMRKYIKANKNICARLPLSTSTV